MSKNTDHHGDCECGLRTRREFLRTSFLGAAMAWSVPVFLEQTFGQLHAHAADSSVQFATGKDSPILVVVQMAGGNDGLNTVIPYADDLYYSNRPRLAVANNEVFKLNDYCGLHPKLEGLASLHGDSQLGVIQGVGYPNPNRSHFRSTEIWQTAVDSDKFARHGWIGRYFDNYCQGDGALAGVAIGKIAPQSFAAKSGAGVNFSKPHEFRWIGDGDAEDEGIDEHFHELNSLEEVSGSSIEDIRGNSTPDTGEDTLAFLERTALDAQMSSEQVIRVASKNKTSIKFPASRLSRDLELVARLIAGSLPTRIYYVSQGGYDTHVNQRGTHERLLGELDGAITAFCREMQKQGNLDRVTVMTFSEFGRRLAENNGAGTDHGAAAPMFVAGGNVVAGMHGSYPKLNDLYNGDLKHTVDFRSVYASILQSGLGVDPAKVLGRKFSTLPIIRQTV